jgi:hypothetical protein
MDTSEPIPTDPFELEMLGYNGWIYTITLIALIITVIYSFKNGGVRQVIENVFLWFLLAFGFLNLFTYPADTDDELTAVISFLAFGVCRIAKHCRDSNWR